MKSNKTFLRRIFDLNDGDQFLLPDGGIGEIISPYGFAGIPDNFGRLANTARPRGPREYGWTKIKDNKVYYICPQINRHDIRLVSKNYEVEVVGHAT